MAIKRLDPEARFRVICDLDDALINETPEELKEILDNKDLTRHEDYLQDLDEKKLKFAEGAKPSHFVIRCLKNDEWTDMQSRHMVLDSMTKTFRVRDNASYLFEMFNKGCIGLEDENGEIKPVNHNEIGIGVAMSIGATISLFTMGGKHLKKQ
jgi:hypothetical protein